MMEAVLVRNADRMMTSAKQRKQGIQFAFADGCKGLVPYSDLPDIKDTVDLKIEFTSPYELVLRDREGREFEIPWDFARHYCDPQYRPRVEVVAKRGNEILGKRLRALRKELGLSQEKLGGYSGVGRVTVNRIENGEQSPRYDTLEALAKALNLTPATLMTGHDDSGEVGPSPVG